MAKKTVAVASAQIVEVQNIIEVQPTIKTVKIGLTQENSKGKITASFVFAAQGENLDGFIEDTAQKIVRVMELQAQIKSNGGASNFAGLTKSGTFELNVTMAENGEHVRVLNNFTFSLKKLGERPVENLVLAVNLVNTFTPYNEPELLVIE